MSKLTEEQLNQISYRIARLPVPVEDSAAKKDLALDESETLVETEEDRLMAISKRIAQIR